MQWGNAMCESCVNRNRQDVCQACRMAPGPAGHGWQWTMYRPKNGQYTFTTQYPKATQTNQATKATQQSGREPPHQPQSQPQSQPQPRLGGMSPSSALTVLREFVDWRRKWRAYDWLTTAPAKDFPFTSDTVDEALDTAVEFLQERVP